MCDTFIALPSVTRDRHTILGKNSDREPDEAQAIVQVLRSRHPEGQRVACTYINIPQVQETNACILSKPFHMWGAEMGVNEWGVAIGNEAVFTRIRHRKKNDGLTGMDLLRLALERSRTADEAVDVITRLLEEFGQDACGGYRNRNFYYDNSFMVADPTSAWILETAGRAWVAQPVTGMGSISNRLTLSAGARMSPDASAVARAHGWWDGRSPFDFARAYSDWFYTWMGRGMQRQVCTLKACTAQQGLITAASAQRILQTHNLDDADFTPRKATTGSICMHRTSLLNPSDTTGSMVVELRPQGPHTVWLTGTSHPCLSVYIPFFLNTGTLDLVGQPGANPDGSLWWRAKRLHDWISRDFRRRKAALEPERQALQQSFCTLEQQLISGKPTAAQLEEFSKNCLKQLLDALQSWASGIKVEV